MSILRLARKYWPCALPAVALSIAMGVTGRQYGKLRQERERLAVELAHAQIAPPVVRDTIRDTVRVTTSAVVVMEKATYRKEVADKRLLGDLGLGAAQVEAQQTTGTETRDTVRLSAKGGTTFAYRDHWADFRLTATPADTLLAYAVRDSVVTLVHREYRHRFLWWR